MEIENSVMPKADLCVFNQSLELDFMNLNNKFLCLFVVA